MKMYHLTNTIQTFIADAFQIALTVSLAFMILFSLAHAVKLKTKLSK